MNTNGKAITTTGLTRRFDQDVLAAHAIQLVVAHLSQGSSHAGHPQSAQRASAKLGTIPLFAAGVDLFRILTLTSPPFCLRKSIMTLVAKNCTALDDIKKQKRTKSQMTLWRVLRSLLVQQQRSLNATRSLDRVV